ncbi:MAG: hypothetical protein M0P69_14965 [Bacteroidales bacterium]|nr:hypothetical protein [Bacteroidales bacterium]
MSNTIDQVREDAIRADERRRIAVLLTKRKMCASWTGECTGDCEAHWQKVLGKESDESGRKTRDDSCYFDRTEGCM